MFRIQILILVIATLFQSACTSNGEESATYYFDPLNGNDIHKGLSPNQAFRSLNKIKELKLRPGDSLLLKSGTTFEEQLYLSSKGTPEQPIVVDKYGGETKPHIKGDGSQLQSVYVLNSEHVRINSLEISNKGNAPIAGLYGIKVELRNYGTAKDIRLNNLFVHDVYGKLTKKDQGGGAGIMLMNYRKDTPDSISSRFDGLIVENCHVQNCQRNGIMMMGNWIRKEWFPNLNVTIRNNVIDGVPGDGIVPVACDSPLVEYNVMKNCPATLPQTEACDGIWPWSCDNALIQYNIVSGHRSVIDGYAYDSDWNSKNSVFRFNISYNNDGGFLLVCNSGGWTTDWSIGNIGTEVKYNISINDGLRDYVPDHREDYFSPIIHIPGPVKNTRIEKNLIYVFKKPKPFIDKTILDFSDWKGFADSTYFHNNYLFLEEKNTAVTLENSTHNFFSDNQYVGELIAPKQGFHKYEGDYNKSLWYDKKDENWDKLIAFLKDKEVTINGNTYLIQDLIGAK